MLPKRILDSAALPGALVSAVALVAYLLTLEPTVTFIDSGELAAVATTLGIAHPTGYPLFTLLGRLFSMVPDAAEEVTRLNVMAAVFSAAGVFVFSLLMRDVLLLMLRRSQGASTFPRAIPAASGGAALLLAFSETYWSGAVSVEVYPLHVLFLSLLMYLFLRAVYRDALRREDPATPAGPHRDSRWYLFAFVLGLSFTNHMTTILLAPGFLYLYFSTQGGGRGSLLRLARMLPPFLLGLSVYVYLPVRASQSPALNWGDATSPERFWWHFTGKQYRVWIFSSTEAAGRQFSYFLGTLPGELTIVGLILAAAGLIVLWRGQRRLWIWSVLLFLSCVLYSINYDIHDIDSYFLLAYFMMALWAGCALAALSGWVGNRWGAPVAAALVLATCCVPLGAHYTESDQSRNYLVEDYTKNMFNSFQQGALVLSYQWDYWVSASMYYQIVRGYRPDVIVIDKELLRRSWYLKELSSRYPRLLRRSQPEVDAFLHEVSKFEHGLPYDAAVIEARYRGMISSFIHRSMEEGPVYVTEEVEPQYTQGLERVPEGLAFRLAADTVFRPVAMPRFRYRSLGGGGRLQEMIPRLYADALVSRGLYYYRKRADLAEAGKSVRSALSYDPGNSRALQFRAFLGRQGGADGRGPEKGPEDD